MYRFELNFSLHVQKYRKSSSSHHGISVSIFVGINVGVGWRFWLKFLKVYISPISVWKYSRTSIDRTPIARLPWLIQTHFWVPTNSPTSSRKQIFREVFLFYHEIVCCMDSLELPYRGNSNEYTQHTIIVNEIKKKKKKIPKLSLFASWPGTMINPQWLELPMSRTIFYGPKDVWE